MSPAAKRIGLAAWGTLLAQSAAAAGLQVVLGDLHEYVAPWPVSAPGAARQFHCFTSERPRVRGSIEAWTDKRMQVVAIASGEPGRALPAATAAMLKSSPGSLHDGIRAANSGLALKTVTHDRFILQAAGTRWTCMPDHDD